MDEMLKAISRFPNGTYLKLEWTAANVTLGGIIDTIYQTDNGKPENTSTFREYYACAFRIKDVIQNLSSIQYSANTLMEVSMEAPPSKITLKNDVVVWCE